MRKNALAMSIATLIGGLGFVGAASADVIVGTGAAPSATVLGATTATTLQINNGGIGHSLIQPYFNAQAGNATLISVVNTDTVNGKAVKMRFRGASNSDDILDFTLLLSPGDVWNATITAGTGTAQAQITTNDRTCTLPQLVAGTAYPFVTNRLTTKSGNDISNNTREGYVEIFNMADIQMTSALGKTILHSAGVPKCDATVLNPAVLNTNWTTEAGAAGAGLATPTTGLFGDWAIINVPQTTTFSGEMIALRALVSTNPQIDGRGNFVLFPQSAIGYPVANINSVTADPLFRTDSTTNKDQVGVGTLAAGLPAINAAYFDMPDMSTPYTAPSGVSTGPLEQASELTAALAVNAIMNTYVTEPTVGAKTDWTFAMPTRRYSVSMDYSTATSRRLFTKVGTGITGGSGNQWFFEANSPINTFNPQQICVAAQSQTYQDREEGLKTSGAVFSPGNLTVTQFCGEVSVQSFNDGGASVLSATVARQNISGDSIFTNGWGTINVFNGVTGLPVVGDSFQKAINPNATAGTSGTYGLSFAHRFTR